MVSFEILRTSRFQNTATFKKLSFYQFPSSLLTYFQKSKTPSVIPFWRAFFRPFNVTGSKVWISGHFKWLSWWSGSIYKKWWPCKVIEARGLKFCMGPCMTNTLSNELKFIFKFVIIWGFPKLLHTNFLISDVLTNRSILIHHQFMRKCFILTWTVNFEPGSIRFKFVFEEMNLKT